MTRDEDAMRDETAPRAVHRYKQGVCKRGHVYAETGTTTSGQCLPCYTSYQREYYDIHRRTLTRGRGQCRRGHLYAETGKTAGGVCRVCYNDYQRRYKATQRAAIPTTEEPAHEKAP